MKVILTFNEMRRDGMGTAALTLTRALKAQGVDVQPIHAWKEINFPEYEAEAKPMFAAETERIDPIESAPQVRNLVVKLNALGDDSDVIIDSGSPNWMCTIPYLKPGLRWVTCVHSINPSTLKLCRAYPERVSAFVCISKGVMDRFLKKLPRKYHNKVSLITNAVAECKAPKTDYVLSSRSTCSPKCAEEACFEGNIASGDPKGAQACALKILYVGRIEATSKGCDKIPKILAELRRRGIPATCDFYGYFHNWEQEFWAAVDKAGVRDQVNYRGEVAHEDIYKIMPQYDVFLAPSNFEGFGLSIAEAMNAGLPVLASKINGVTDWLVDYGKAGVVVDKRNIAAFVDALENIYRDAAYRESIGKMACQRIQELASFEAHGRNYADLARQVSAAQNYQMVTPVCDLEHFEKPECLKPWGPARLLPTGVKNFLRRFM